MNQAEAEGLAAILQLFGWGLFGWILFNSPRVWARGWLIAARGVLSGLWRSVAPFHSSAPALGPSRPTQGAWGSLHAQHEVGHRIHDVTKLRLESCNYCRETDLPENLPHGCAKELEAHRLTQGLCGRCGVRTLAFDDRNTCFECELTRTSEQIQDRIIQAFSVPDPLVRKVSCPNCLEPVAEIAMPHTACPADLIVPKHQIGYRSLNIPCPWE